MNTVEFTLDNNLNYAIDIRFTSLGPVTFCFLSIAFA